MAEVSSDGVAIHYEVEGAGPPILLHTGGGGDLEMWRQAGYVEGLDGLRIMLMDHRGHGRSGRPRKLEDHRIIRHVGDVLAVGDALGLERFAFFGYSGGSEVGYAVAARHPDRIAALVGLGAVGGPDESPEDRRDRAAAVRAHGMTTLVHGLRAAEVAIPEWFELQMLGTDPEKFALALEGWADWDGAWSAFPQIQSETLVLVGELEEGPGREAAANAEAAAAMMPRGRAVILPGLGHVAAFTRSDLVLPHVRAFLHEALV